MTAPAPKRGRGRPELPDSERRDVHLDVRVSAAEAEQAERVREARGYPTIAAMVRSLIAKADRR